MVSYTEDPYTEPHASPIQLLDLRDHVPQYLKDIITLCRSEDKSRREPAVMLVEMLPSVQATMEDMTRPGSDPKYITRPEDCQEKYGWSVHCDVCKELATHLYFHCDICSEGAFELCLGCFSNGLHCSNDSHYLREVGYSDGERVGSRHHSSLNEDGNRVIYTIQ